MLSRRDAFSVGIFLATCFIAREAFAGKPERDKQDEVTPKVAEAAKNVETACGCKVEMAVAWDSYKKADDMFRIPETVGAFSDNAKEQCNNAANKKAFCSNVSRLEVGFSADGGAAEYDVKTKTIKSKSHSSSYTGAHQFKKITDVF